MTLLEYENEIKNLNLNGWILTNLEENEAKWVKSQKTLVLYIDDEKFKANYYNDSSEKEVKSLDSSEIDVLLDSISKKFK